jgi:hypothetical protein
MYDINILSNYSNILKFKSLQNFKMDLGKSFIDAETKMFKIEDPFIAHIMVNKNRNIQKIGKAGKINFYYDLNIDHNDIEIYFDTIQFKKPLNTLDVDKWLKNTLIEIKKELKSSSVK